MAHYAYKHACHDIDYKKFQQLVEKYKAENNGEYDGESSYDGDNWYIMAMWIRELRTDLEALTKENDGVNKMKEKESDV